MNKVYVLFKNNEPLYVSYYKDDLAKITEPWSNSHEFRVDGPFELKKL